MNFFRRRQDNRRKKPRPEGRVANFFQGVVSLVFYCILNDAAGGHDEREVVNEPSAGTTSAHSSTKPLTIDTLVDHRRTNHEPRPCLISLSSSITHSTSVGRLQEGKGDGKTSKPTEEKKENWFSWFKKGSNKNKVTKERETKNHDESAKLASASTNLEPSRLSESSFKILQLTASPGGARKAYTSRLCAQPVRKADQIHNDACPGFGNTIEDVDLDSATRKLDNTSIGGDKPKLETFSLSDVSSFASSEMSDNDSSSSFTEVTSLSSGKISDCWGLSDGQLPPSKSSSITDSFTDDGQDHIQVSKTPVVEGTMSASSDASESDDTPGGAHSLESKDIPATCFSGSADTKVLGDSPNDAVDKEAPSTDKDADISVDIDTSDSINIEVPTVGPNAAAGKEAPTASSDSAAILGYIDAPHSADIEVPTDAPNTVETSDSTDRFGEVPGGTITDVYSLIRRTLILGFAKPTNPVTSGGQDDNKTADPHHRSSSAGLKAQCNDVESEERTSKVPEHTTPSLHKLHTEWPEHHVNIEVFLGLKTPKNSFEALAVQNFNKEKEALGLSNNVCLKINDAVSSAEKDNLTGSIEAESISEMAVDSGVGSNGDCISSGL